MKALPITHKATRSPLKLSDEALVENDRQVHKQFNDVATDYANGRKEGIGMTKQKAPQRKPVEESKDTPKLQQPPINAKDQPQKTV